MRFGGPCFVAACLLSVTAAWLPPAAASAASCGDGVVEVGEQCDDGNIEDGDCCSASCTYDAVFSPCTHQLTGACVPDPVGICDGLGKCLADVGGRGNHHCSAYGFGAQFTIRDESGTSDDELSWSLRPGKWRKYNSAWIADSFGDPTVDTTYTFCVYEIHNTLYSVKNVIYERVLAAGAPWEHTSKGWTYHESTLPGQPAGELEARISDRARFRVSGEMAGLPGPINATEYFNGAGVIGVALVGSKGRCFAHRAGGHSWKPRWNKPTRYRFWARSYVND